MMDSPVDNTAVIRMSKDFDMFLSDRTREDRSLHLNLDGDVYSKRLKSTQQNSRTNQAVKIIIEKEREEKLKEAELLAAQGQIIQLKTQLASSHTSNKRARIEFEKDVDTIKQEWQHDKECLSDVRAKLRNVTELEQRLRAEVEEERRGWESACSSLENKLRKLQREKLQLEEDIQKVREESWQQTMELKREAGQCLAELKLNVTELEETRAQLQLQKKRVDELTIEVAELRQVKGKLTNAEEKILDLESELLKQAEDASVTRALRADIDKVSKLEKEVSFLRAENEYHSERKELVLLLQEQLSDLQYKLELAKQRCEDFIKLQVEHEELKERLNRWEAEDESGSRRPRSPSELSRLVSDLQMAQAVALEQQGQLKSSLAVANLKLQETQKKELLSQSQLKTQEQQVRQQEELIKQLRRKLLLVSKERESYKRILDEFESEATVTVPAVDHVRELEEILEGYRHQMKKLETQLEQTTRKHSELYAHCQQLEYQHHAEIITCSSQTSLADQDKIQQLQEQLASMEAEVKKLTEDKNILEMRIEQRHMQGDYDPTKTKVLHLTVNPASQAQQQREQEVKRLQEENARMATRLQLLEQSGGKVEDLTLQVEKNLESVPESKIIEDLKTQLSQEELRKQRLVEAFKKTSQEFRETCYQLLGYKIDIVGTGQYRLASMYSDSPHDNLLFKQGPSREIQLLETDFSARQQDKMDMYLKEKNSIPAMLSAITLDLFQHQTMNLG